MGRVDPLTRWAQWMRAEGATDKTIDTRVGGIRTLSRHADRDPLDLDTSDIVAWLADQRSGWTRRTYAISARQWHRWLMEQGIREDDPTVRIKMPPAPRSVPRPASSAAIEAVLDGAPRRVRAYVLLAAFQGLRVAEIARVRGDDFEPDDRGDLWLYVRGKGGTLDVIPVHRLVDAVRRGWPDTGWWFPARTGAGHVLGNSVSRSINQALHRAGYPDTAHQLRHWYGTHTLRISRDLRTTQELMRHRSVSSTQIYTEVSRRAKQDTVRQLTHRFTHHHWQEGVGA